MAMCTVLFTFPDAPAHTPYSMQNQLHTMTTVLQVALHAGTHSRSLHCLGSIITYGWPTEGHSDCCFSVCLSVCVWDQYKVSTMTLVSTSRSASHHVDVVGHKHVYGTMWYVHTVAPIHAHAGPVVSCDAKLPEVPVSVSVLKHTRNYFP